jgi:hypothetical protein
LAYPVRLVHDHDHVHDHVHDGLRANAVTKAPIAGGSATTLFAT